MATSPSWYGNYTDREHPTLNSVADYITEARILLQDKVSPYRYEDPSLLTAINLALLDARRLRPDLFVWNLEVDGQVQSFQEIDDTYVVMEVPYRQAIVHGLCAHALERDQEDYQDSRATSFWAMFTQGLTGRGIGPVVGGSPPGSGKRGER
jgi:hypothetical protein